LPGLPGLIVDAHDVKNEVVFKFDGIEEITKAKTADAKPDMQHSPMGGGVVMFGMGDTNQDPNLITLPTTGIKTNQKEFENLQAAMRKDPDAFLQSAMAGMGGGGGGMHVIRNGESATPGQNGIKMKIGPQAVINNPIELPETKK
jgi:hypothetical protein